MQDSSRNSLTGSGDTSERNSSTKDVPSTSSNHPPPNVKNIDFQYLSLSDSEIIFLRKKSVNENETCTRESVSAREIPITIKDNSKLSSLNPSISTEKRKLIDELILEDFESQSTDKTTSEELTATTETESSLVTEEPSSTKVFRGYLHSNTTSATTSTEEYRSTEMGLPDFLVLNISGVSQLDLGSSFVQVSPEVYLRSDYCLLLNAPPLGHQIPLKYLPTQNEDDSSSNNDKQTTNTIYTTAEDGKTKTRGNSPRSFGETNLRLRLTGNTRIYPIDEISENSENASLRSKKSQQNALDIQERLQAISESVQDCHRKRPISRKTCWDSDLINETLLVLPNQVPEPFQEGPSLTNAFKISLSQSEEKLDTEIDSPSPFRKAEHTVINTTPMWSTINEIEVINCNPNNNVRSTDQYTSDCTCCSWITRLFKFRKMIGTKSTISKTYLVRWRKSKPNKHSLVRSNSSFF